MLAGSGTGDWCTYFFCFAAVSSCSLLRRMWSREQSRSWAGAVRAPANGSDAGPPISPGGGPGRSGTREVLEVLRSQAAPASSDSTAQVLGWLRETSRASPLRVQVGRMKLLGGPPEAVPAHRLPAAWASRRRRALRG